MITLHDQSFTEDARLTVIFDDTNGAELFANATTTSTPRSPPRGDNGTNSNRNETAPYGLRGRWVYLRTKDGNFLSSHCCLEGESCEVLLV